MKTRDMVGLELQSHASVARGLAVNIFVLIVICFSGTDSFHTTVHENQI